MKPSFESKPAVWVLLLGAWCAGDLLAAGPAAGVAPGGATRRVASRAAFESDRVKKLEAQVAELQAQVRQLLEAQGGQKLPAATRVPTPDDPAGSPGSPPPPPSPGRGGLGGGPPGPGGELTIEERARLEAEFAGALGGGPSAGGGPRSLLTDRRPPARGDRPPAGHPSKSAEPASPPRGASSTGTPPSLPPPLPPPATGAGAAGVSGGGGRLKLIDVSVSLLGDLSASSANEGTMRDLQGGDHDPKHKGFTAPNEELVLGGVVDPNFRGDLILLAKIGEHGETEVELEEAYLTTLSMGHGLQLKAGTFLTEFGRFNTQHPHSWDFVNQPVILSRVMSPESMRGPGARLAWLLPADEYYRLYLTAQAPEGGPMASFRSDPTDPGQFAGYTFSDLPVEGAGDLVCTARLETSRDLSDELTVVPGLSFATGPNATGPEARTRLFGFDVFAKWRPLANDHGFPFWSFQAEALRRSYQAASAPFAGDPAIQLPATTLDDWGFYAQVVHGFKRNWTWGLRADYANGNGDNGAEPFRDRRWRLSPNLTHYFSEFSKLRYQYDYDRAEHLGDEPEHTFTVQYEVNFGAHAAHKF